MNRRVMILAAAMWLTLGQLVAVAQPQATVTIFAAASLKNALDEAVAAWSMETGKSAKVSYAASSAGRFDVSVRSVAP